MSTEIEKPGSNVFLAYGNAATTRSIVGKLLKFSKGDFLAGMEDEEVKLGTRFIAHMSSLCVGWIRWEDNKPTEQRMGLVAEGYQPHKRKELGDLDEGQWERDDEGQPRDPWQFSNHLILIARDGGDLYTFTTSSRGGLSAIGELCKSYGKQIRQRPDQHPVIELDVGSYQHSNRSYGRIKFPVFTVVDWASKAEIEDGAPAGPHNPPAADDKPALDIAPLF
jgi:hypothetical protein